MRKEGLGGRTGAKVSWNQSATHEFLRDRSNKSMRVTLAWRWGDIALAEIL